MDLTFLSSYAVLLFTSSNFTSITHHIHNCVLFLLWLCLFILSGVISSLISYIILGTYQPGEFIFQCPIILPFHTVHGVLKARILKWFAFPFPSGPHGEVRTLHHDLSIWVALHSMVHSFIELDKAAVHVIRLVSFLWLWFSVCLPSDGEEFEAYGSFLMGETDWGGNWFLFWWAGPCSVNLQSNFLLMGMAVFTACYLPGAWHPTPVLMPGKSYGWRSLVGCSPWGR